MQSADWEESPGRTLGCLMMGIEPDSGEMTKLLTIFHAGHTELFFILPSIAGVDFWEVVLDSTIQGGMPQPQQDEVRKQIGLAECSTVVLLGRQQR